MRIPIFTSIASLAIIFAAASCNDDGETTCIGGSGGQLTIVATLKHHGEIIPNLPDSLGGPDTVWIKYNTQEWSNAPIGRDTMFIGEEGEDHIHLESLKCGKYYLYASGYDTTLQEIVRGGIPISTTQTTGELLIDIPITE